MLLPPHITTLRVPTAHAKSTQAGCPSVRPPLTCPLVTRRAHNVALDGLVAAILDLDGEEGFHGFVSAGVVRLGRQGVSGGGAQLGTGLL